MLIGLGLPRTGSTALSYLLAQDRNVRSLRQWEANQPTPPPDTRRPRTPIRASWPRSARSADAERVPSELQSMLPSSPDGPAECLDLLSMTFRCMALDVMAKTPSYAHWLYTECDFEPGVPVPPPRAEAACSGTGRRHGGGSRPRRTCSASNR